MPTESNSLLSDSDSMHKFVSLTLFEAVCPSIINLSR